MSGRSRIGLIAIIFIAVRAHASNCVNTPDLLNQNIRAYDEIVDRTTPRLPASHSRNVKVAVTYDGHHRDFPDSKKYPWSAIGKVKIGGREDCSGFLVDSCHVLTAKHCFLTNEKIFIPPDAITPQSYFVSSNGVSTAKAGQFEAGPADFIERPVRHAKTPEGDYAFMTLEKPIGREVGWLGLAKTNSTELTGHQESWLVGETFGYNTPHLIAAGYSGDISAQADHEPGTDLSADHEAEPIVGAQTSPDLINFQGDIYPGASGGPLFRYNAHQEPEVVGILISSPFDQKHGAHVHYSKNEKANLAQAVTTNSFYDAFVKYAKAHPCSENSRTNK